MLIGPQVTAAALLALTLPLAGLLSGCGGGGASAATPAEPSAGPSADGGAPATPEDPQLPPEPAPPAPDPPPPEPPPPESPPAPPPDSLGEFLYQRSTAAVSYWPDWQDVPDTWRYVEPRLAHVPFAVPDVRSGLFSIAYASNTLPQLSLYLRRDGNRKLLVYNHGHAGLPTEQQVWASTFLGSALAGGWDLLITSMPFTGLNAVRLDDGARYLVSTRDSAAPAQLALGIPESFWGKHAVYEMLDDPDHYFHYFIDGALVPLQALTGPGTDATPYLPSPDNVPDRSYDEISYVGLSAGATVGIVACAVHRFHRCILVAGVMPDYLRLTDPASMGDWEQVTRSFYQHFPVPALMRLARDKSGRLTFIYNRRDNCCFRASLASRFQQDFPDYDIRLTDLNYHGYSAENLLAVLAEE